MTLYFYRYDKSIKDVIYVPSSQDRNEKIVLPHKQQQDNSEIVLSPFSLNISCTKNNNQNNTPKISLIEEISSSVDSLLVGDSDNDSDRLNKTNTATIATKVTIKNTCQNIKKDDLIDSQNFQTSFFQTSHPIFKAPDIVSYVAATYNNQTNHYVAIYSIYMKSIQVFKIDLTHSSSCNKDTDIICIKKLEIKPNQTCKGLKLLFHKERLTLLILYAKELENEKLNNKIPVIK